MLEANQRQLSKLLQTIPTLDSLTWPPFRVVMPPIITPNASTRVNINIWFLKRLPISMRSHSSGLHSSTSWRAMKRENEKEKKKNLSGTKFLLALSDNWIKENAKNRASNDPLAAPIGGQSYDAKTEASKLILSLTSSSRDMMSKKKQKCNRR